MSEPISRKPVRSGGKHTSTASGQGSLDSKPYIVEGATHAPDLTKVVDLTNTVDTDVKITHNPAVVHEHVTNQIREIQQKVITREIHTHDVYHRILPITQTEILPPVHFIQSPTGDGLVRVAASQLPHSGPGAYRPSFRIVPNEKPLPATPAPPSSAAARDDPQSIERTPKARADSNVSPTKHTVSQEPVLLSTRHSKTVEGAPRIEYIWRHPPTLELAERQDGVSIPIHNIGDISRLIPNHRPLTPNDDLSIHYEQETERGNSNAHVREGDLLFRDSGYGKGGHLPGLRESAPLSKSMPGAFMESDSDGYEEPTEEVAPKGSPRTASGEQVGRKRADSALTGQSRSERISGLKQKLNVLSGRKP